MTIDSDGLKDIHLERISHIVDGVLLKEMFAGTTFNLQRVSENVYSLVG